MSGKYNHASPEWATWLFLSNWISPYRLLNISSNIFSARLPFLDELDDNPINLFKLVSSNPIFSLISELFNSSLKSFFNVWIVVNNSLYSILFSILFDYGKCIS